MSYSIEFKAPQDLIVSEDDIYEAEFDVLSWGSPALYWCSADPPEIEISEITINGEPVPYYSPSPFYPFLRWLYENFGFKKPKKKLNPLWQILYDAAEDEIFESFDFVAERDYDPY